MTPDADKRLLLVDGHGMAYRAFHAITPLTTQSGRPTNAVYGFIRMLHQLEQVWKPTHWAVVFDGGLPRERLEKLPTYKAQRPPMPEDLRQQFEPMSIFLKQSRIASLRMEGQEADDLMASIARDAEGQGFTVYLATSDKDMFQLVDDRVYIVPPSKIGEKMGVDEVYAKTGVRPPRIVEWLSLIGDNVDNIPGVPGIGPKTAARLLNQFETLDSLWARVSEVESERIRQALMDHKEDVIRNVDLMTLNLNLPVPMPLAEMDVKVPDPGELLPFYEEMEFGRLADELRKKKRTERAPDQNLTFDFGA